MPEPSRPNADVRMRGFSGRTTVAEVLAWIDRHVQPLADEMAPVDEAAGRVLASDVVSEVNVPGFSRSMMDGFAVRAADTSGASPYNRLALATVGQSMPARPFGGSVAAGQAVKIMTGAPMPEGADAVLPVEWVEIRAEGILIQGEVGCGKHVGCVGEDIAAGRCVLEAGRVLRPQDLGLLASIGHGQVPVVRRPVVRIMVTGSELLPAGAMPQGYRIVDANGPMLVALAARDGAVVDRAGILQDDAEVILQGMRAEADLVVISGGSSVGQEDHVPVLLGQHGDLPIHGIAMRPSSPAGIGLLDGRPVFLVPGNPVSCLCAYDFFAGRAIRLLGGRSAAWPYRSAKAPLRRKIVSAIGRLDYVRVRLVEGQVDPLAIGGASVLSSTTRADGFVVVPPDSEGFPPDTQVDVFLYD